MVNKSGYRRDIDGLRAFAVLPVVLAHAGVPGFAGGFVGVDVFFVISGYLITGILLREIRDGRFSLATFYERRARRILPALFSVLLVCIAVGWFVLPPDMFKELAQSVLATVFFVSNIRFWESTGDYFGTAAEWEPLLHTWSLSVEEQFYLAFPLLLCLLAGRHRNWLLGTVAGISGLSFAASIWATSAQPFANYFLTPFRVWELGLGALLALGAAPSVRHRGAREFVATAGLAMILASVFLYDSSTPFPGLAALLPCVGAAAIIWAGAQSQPRVSRLLSLPLFVGVGLVSYSLYLWHWPVLVLMRLLNGSAELPLAWGLAAIVLSLFLAFVSWKLVETPFRRGGAAGMSRRAVVRFSAACAGATVFVALLINVNKGFPSRVPEALFATYSDAIERTPRQRACMDRLPREGLCEFGGSDGSGKRMEYLLWGDSHAAAFLPGYASWLRASGSTGLAAVKSACAPLLGVVRVEMGAAHGCDRFNEDVIALLEGREDIDTVILVARWALVVEGSRSSGERGPAAILGRAHASRPDVLAGSEGAQVTAHNAELAEFGLAATVQRIRATGRKVLIVEGIPEISFSVPMALVNAEFIGADLQEAPDRAEVERRNRRANEIIAAVAGQFGAQRTSLLTELCNPRCRIQRNGVPLYRDDDHLSRFGALALVPPLLESAISAETKSMVAAGGGE